MNTQHISVGLDIGTTKIIAMVGRKSPQEDKVEILGWGRAKSMGVHKGVVNNITHTTEAIEEALREAQKSAGVKIERVVVGIAGQHIRSLQHSDYITRGDFEKVIEQKDIQRLIEQVNKLVMLPGEEIIHVLPQEYKVDSQGDIKEPIGMYGSRLEANFHIVIGQISSIRNIGRCIKAAGLKLEGITLEPLASAAAVLSQEEKEAGVALIDIGGGTTDIAIFKDDIIHSTAVIPFGGNIITEDIKVGCSIIERQAELLKVKFGSAWPGENKETEIVSIPGLRGRDPKEISLKRLSQIIHARIEEIIEQSYMAIKGYGHEEQKKRLIAGIVMTGGGSKLRHIRPLTECITGMDVRIGCSNEHLIGGLSSSLDHPEYSTAIGLVMKGIEAKQLLASKEELLEKKPNFTVKQQQESLIEEKLVGKKTKKRTKSFIENWADRFRQILNDTE